MAARTYIMRNRGQYKDEGYDICATDMCQVYLGAGTEDPLATQAVAETRGVIATYGGQPINALYSSTCGGRTESSENIFGEKLPYLVSTVCQYKHPEPLPLERRGARGRRCVELYRRAAVHGIAGAGRAAIDGRD